MGKSSILRRALRNVAGHLNVGANATIPPLTADGGCSSDPRLVADMSRFTPGAPAVHCRPWNVVPGVQGYVWEAPEPRAHLLLQHGHAEYAQRFVQQYNALIPNLLKRGITVYAIDMRGHGRSSGRRFTPDLRDAVDDHLAARRSLQTQPLPLFLLGHSLGGIVTAGSVARDPEGVTGVILSSPLLAVKASVFLRVLARTLNRVMPGLVVNRAGTRGLSRIPEQAELASNDPWMQVRGVSARVAHTALELIRESWERFPQWRTPVLVFHGTADTATDPAGSTRFIQTIPAADKTLRLFEGGYHEVLNDLDRDEALQMILDWLDARTRDRRAPL